MVSNLRHTFIYRIALMAWNCRLTGRALGQYRYPSIDRIPETLNRSADLLYLMFCSNQMHFNQFMQVSFTFNLWGSSNPSKFLWMIKQVSAGGQVEEGSGEGRVVKWRRRFSRQSEVFKLCPDFHVLCAFKPANILFPNQTSSHRFTTELKVCGSNIY